MRSSHIFDHRVILIAFLAIVAVSACKTKSPSVKHFLGYHISPVDSIRLSPIPLREYFLKDTIDGLMVLEVNIVDGGKIVSHRADMFEAFATGRKHLLYRYALGPVDGRLQVIADTGDKSLHSAFEQLTGRIIDSVKIFPSAKANQILNDGDTLGLGLYVDLKHGIASIAR